MFDLEGLPPQLDELDKVFLWGMEIYGQKQSPYLYSLAGPGSQGDEEGWLQFLELSDKIFGEYGDVPFVHWAAYEKTKINAYISRYGDRNSTGEKVLDHLVDLLPAVKESVVLPLPSYSLKVAEKYVGFERELKEGKGDWAMARFIEATETSDQKAREEIINEILLYNEEDLKATWAVLSWVMRECPIKGNQQKMLNVTRD
jgi:predicted RecB family nuclease